MNRAAFVFLLVVGLICVALLLVNAKFSREAEPLVAECVHDEDRVNIRRMVLDAVDEAFKEHMRVLFAGWIKDPSNQPHRASAGVQAAIVAYQRARTDALRWTPKSCEKKP